MRVSPIATALALATLASAGAARAPSTPDTALAGRTAGAPVSCIEQPMIDSSETFDSGDILYRMKSGVYYLNSPRPRCPGLRRDTGTVTRTPSTSLCRGDIADVVDFTSHFNYGGCPLGDFVPYKKPGK